MCAPPPLLRHPALAFVARWLPGASLQAMPDHATLNRWGATCGLALRDGRPLRFVPSPAGERSAIAYERRIVEHAEIITRQDSLHDLFNALAWLRFPRTKARLSALHVGDGAATGWHLSERGARRDAATLLDESGAIVACADPELVELWQSHGWRQLFHDRREEVERNMRIAVIGHGLAAKLFAPFPSLTAKALVLDVLSPPPSWPERSLEQALDDAADAWLDKHAQTVSPRCFLPLPIAAWPGWDAQGRGAERFDDTTVFRPRRGSLELRS